MAFRRSVQSAARVPALSPTLAGNNMTVVSEALSVTGVIVGDVFEMCALPAGCIVSGLTIAAEDWDSSATTLTLNVGIMTGQYLAALDDEGSARTSGAELLSASTVLQAGTTAVSAVAAGHLLVPSRSDRSIGLTLTGTLGTLVVARKVRLYLDIVPAPVGMAYA